MIFTVWGLLLFGRNVIYDVYLHVMTNRLPLWQDLTEVFGPKNISECSGCQQTSGAVGILHVCNGHGSILDAVVHHCINSHSHRVFCQNLQQIIITLKNQQTNLKINTPPLFSLFPWIKEHWKALLLLPETQENSAMCYNFRMIE